jgi:Ca-activated chloride channel family protein
MRLKELGLTLLMVGCWAGCAATNTNVERRESNGIATTIAEKEPAPDLVDIEMAAVDRFVKAGAPTELLVRIRVDVDELGRKGRAPVNLALAVDTSGSMEGEAIAHEREACQKLVDALSDGDRLSIVTFDTRPELLVPSTVLDKKSRAVVAARIRSIDARGTTDLAGGLSTALSQVIGYRQPDGINRIVLLGDGVPNDASTLPGLAQQAKQQGIAITSLGLGLDYDETVMGQLAQVTGGKFHYVKAAEDITAVLKDEVLKIERVAGRGATVQLVAGPGVTIHEVVGQGSPPAARVNVALGDLLSGEHRDLVVRLTVPARSAGAVIELLDAEVIYQDALGSNAQVRKDSFLSVRASDDEAQLKAGHDREVELSAARASVAALVVQAIATARAGVLPEAHKLIDRAEKLAREEGRALDDAELLAKAAEMSKLRKSLASLVPMQPVQPLVPTGGGPGTSMAPAPPRPVNPADAAAVREAHGEAMRSLQGG